MTEFCPKHFRETHSSLGQKCVLSYVLWISSVINSFVKRAHTCRTFLASFRCSLSLVMNFLHVSPTYFTSQLWHGISHTTCIFLFHFVFGMECVMRPHWNCYVMLFHYPWYTSGKSFHIWNYHPAFGSIIFPFEVFALSTFRHFLFHRVLHFVYWPLP